MPVLPLLQLFTRAGEDSRPTDSAAPDMYAAEFITFVVGSICFIARIFSRYMTRNPLWWDDYFAIASYFTGVAWMISCTVWLHNGLGTHIWIYLAENEMTFKRTMYINKLLTFIIEMLYAYCLFFGKASILFFYWRMFKTSSIKIPIQILGACSLAWIIIRTFMRIFICYPTRSYWDDDVHGNCTVSDAQFFFATTLTHVLIDVAILSLPIFQINKLHLPTIQKLSVMVMFMFGLFICVAGIVLVYDAAHLDTSIDYTYRITPIIIWASVEVNLMTVSACMPVCRPALKFVMNCGTMGSSTDPHADSSYANSRTYVTSKSKSRRRGSVTHNKTHIDAVDETGSTYELANSINTSNEGEFDQHAMDGPPRTRVTVRRGATTDQQSDPSNPFGIMVKNETSVVHSGGKE